MRRNVMIVRPGKEFTRLVAKKQDRNALCECGSGKKAKKCCGNETKYYSAGKVTAESKKEDK